MALALTALVTLAAGCGTAPSSRTYTVRSGDSFYGIASKTGTDPHKLAAYNGMTIRSYIFPGDVLKVPGGSTSGTRPKAPVTRPKAPSTSFGQRLANEGMKHVGKRYVYGTAGPNTFDCSGQVVYAYKKAGRSIPRYSSSMMAARATRVSKSKMRPGDLVFIYSPVSHVGIYIGNGKMVHASNRDTGVKVSSLSSYRAPWFAGRL
ncbi:MAG: LysM peptidoglycan-binding domain-containing C40 family peptidase [Microthrixaceae bacterium]